jgi:hypothetical protein
MAKEGVEAEHGARVISQPTLAFVKRKAKTTQMMSFGHWWLHSQPGSCKYTGLLASLGPTAELQRLCCTLKTTAALRTDTSASAIRGHY